MHLSTRLTLTLLALVSIVLVVASAADVVILRAVLRHDFALSLGRDATVAARIWHVRAQLPAHLPAGVSVAAYGGAGQLLAHRGSTLALSAPRRAGLHWSGSTLVVARRVATGGWVVVYANAFAFVGQPLARLEQIIADVTGVLLLLAWAVGAWTAGDLARPLSALADRVTRISATSDLQERVQSTSTVVEVRVLADAFDSMLRRLGDVFAALRSSEQRERTLLEATAHDLYTPLTTVLTSLELLVGDQLGPEDRQRTLATARQEAVRLRARLDRALSRGGHETADVGAIAHRLLGGRPRVHLSDEPRTVEVAADPAEVVEVLDILVDNAVRHNAGGTEVWVSWRLSGHQGVVQVRDNGTGIPADRLVAILDEDRVPSTSGLGMGLALARDLLRLRGGDLALESSDRFGVTVEAHWPLV